MNKTKIIAFFSIFLFIGITLSIIETNGIQAKSGCITVKINIDPYTIIYEGDVINCTITGEPTIKYWHINNQSKHTTFYSNDPIIFDPEPTPLDTNYVNLTVYAENENGGASDTVQVMVKRIYFGDIHWHSELSDGHHNLENMYKNAIDDNYLDFASCNDHGFLIPLYKPFIKIIKNWILHKGAWQLIKDTAIKYYTPGKFTTLLGFEWSASNLFPGGKIWSKDGHEDVSHINFYYRDVYPDAPKYSPLFKKNYDDILQAMSDEWGKGHFNIGFSHHPIAKLYLFCKNKIRLFPLFYDVNWSYLAKEIQNPNARDKILRGVEVYSRWGTSIGQYSDIPITWPYYPDIPSNNICISNITNAWVENGMWEWSENLKGRKYAMQAGSDNHLIDRPGSAGLDAKKVAGIIASYSVHNTREEIWDAMNNCSIYGSQLLKIRTNVRFDNQMNLGGWINCTVPLNITITAMSTFTGLDSSGKSMCPHSYTEEELNYPIQDIWLIKKDRDKGRPWCKVINHTTPNTNTAVVNFQDYDVQPNDFYWVAIRQKGQELAPQQNEYMAFIGPVFIDNVD